MRTTHTICVTSEKERAYVKADKIVRICHYLLQAYVSVRAAVKAGKTLPVCRHFAVFTDDDTCKYFQDET